MADKEKFDESCNEMRFASGVSQSTDRMVAFLYMLVRDHLTPSQFSNLVDKVTIDAEDTKKWVFTNGWLAEYVKYELERMKL